jgi:hypothetical protein
VAILGTNQMSRNKAVSQSTSSDLSGFPTAVQSPILQTTFALPQEKQNNGNTAGEMWRNVKVSILNKN